MTLAERLTGPVAAWDGPVNAASDAFNARFGWAWFPLPVPSRDHPLGPPEHALYLVHAALALPSARPLLRRRGGPVLAALIALVVWALPTGAWDRRAHAAALDSTP
jgi:hypothetical protein